MNTVSAYLNIVECDLFLFLFTGMSNKRLYLSFEGKMGGKYISFALRDPCSLCVLLWNDFLWDSSYVMCSPWDEDQKHWFVTLRTTLIGSRIINPLL